ncbi:MAG: FemAB family XrtA/PEP-CTERM system-associated protein [Alphaproteobacteria bacterium]
MTEIRTLDSASEAAWENFVAICPEATFFHKTGWRRVIEKSFGQKAYYLYAESGGEIQGILPLVHVKSMLFGSGLISTAFTVGGGTAALNEPARRALDLHAQRLCADLGAGHIEYRGVSNVPDGWVARDDLYASFSWEIAAREEDNLKQIPRKQRAVVRKAIEAELACAIETDVNNFFELFSASVHRLGTPVQSKRYFMNLLREFGPHDCDILTISAAGQPVSSVLSFYFKDAVLPYFTGGALAARQYGANDLMYWRLMRQARERGYRVFDFGRSKAGTGPYSFKKNWGFTPVPVTHAYYLPDGGPIPNTNPTNPKYELMIKAWQRMPLALANLIGPYIIRGIG